MTDWAEDNDILLPRPGKLGVLLVVLGVLVALAAVLYVTLALGAKAANLAGSLVVRTTHSQTSPDGRWSLLIDTRDSGALGGATTVYLQPLGGGAKTTLWNDEYLPDSAIRWLDARTVSINGWISTPFVEKAIDTGSPQTTGTAADPSGYAHNDIAARERVVMLSGLSLVLPGAASGQLLTRRSAARHQPWQRLVPAASTAWSVAALRHPREAPIVGLAGSGQLLGRSRNGRVEALWDPAARSIVVVTHLPGGLTGLVWERGVSVATTQAARRRVEELWRTLSVEGATLPW